MHSTMLINNLLILCGLSIAAPSVELADAHVIEARHKTWNGKATYYTQDGVAGSCGQKHSGSEYIVAISQQAPFTYNAHCGQTVTITNMGGGQDNNGEGTTITALVADTCPGCENSHLDLSTGAFKALTGGSLDPPGEFNIQWHLN